MIIIILLSSYQTFERTLSSIKHSYHPRVLHTIGTYLPENAIVTTLNFNWESLRLHEVGYIGVENHQLLIENYEALCPWFPVTYDTTKLMYSANIVGNLNLSNLNHCPIRTNADGKIVFHDVNNTNYKTSDYCIVILDTNNVTKCFNDSRNLYKLLYQNQDIFLFHYNHESELVEYDKSIKLGREIQSPAFHFQNIEDSLSFANNSEFIKDIDNDTIIVMEGDQYSSALFYKLYGEEKVEITAWRDTTSGITLNASFSDKYFSYGQPTNNKNEGWEEIRIIINPNIEHTGETCKLYIYNPGKSKGQLKDIKITITNYRESLIRHSKKVMY